MPRLVVDDKADVHDLFPLRFRLEIRNSERSFAFSGAEALAYAYLRARPSAGLLINQKFRRKIRESVTKW